MRTPVALCFLVVVLSSESINVQSQQYTLGDFENQLNVCLYSLYFIIYYKNHHVHVKIYLFTCVKFNTLGFKR